MVMYHPPQCTEREPGKWEDCTWCSGVMLQNAAHGRAEVPSTQTEYEALRKASGDSMEGGSSIADLVRGMKARYGWAPPNIMPTSTSDLWSKLPPGTGAVVQGSMGALSDYWRRWDPNFRGGHAAYVSRDDAKDRVWWMNPLATKDYAGEYMDRAELQAFWAGLDGARIATAIIGSRGEDVGVRVNITGPFEGTATVTGDGHYAIQLADGDFIGVDDGEVRTAYARATLAEPLKASDQTTFPTGTPVVIIGTEVAILFESDVTLAASEGEYIPVPVGQLYVKKP